MNPEEVQTDCTIYPGDSGGPLFDMYGRVIAIHRAIANSTAENFHVPISEFYQTWSRLTALPPAPSEHPRAYCGLSLVDDPDGCRLSKIAEKSPAAKAGLKLGDHLLKVDGRTIELAATFDHWLEDCGPGETLELEIKRGSKTFSTPIKLQSMPKGAK